MWLLLSIPCNAVAQQPIEIMVSAASSLKNVFEEIGRNFEVKQKGIKLYFNFAASGILKVQIENGAPIDVFASAAIREMDDLEKKSLIHPDTRFNFARNSLVVIQPSHTITQVSTVFDLLNPEVKKIAMGNPATVAAGLYTEQALQHYRIFNKIKEKIVYGESVRQVLDYVMRGEVDAGFVFHGDTMIKLNDIRVALSIPSESHKLILYPIAVIKGTKNKQYAKEFISYVLGKDGKSILRKYGFIPVK
jgi:molybdate transport system substrate-binding protein